MNETVIPRSRKTSLKVVLWAFAISVLATTVYMAAIIKTVPKTVSNSKAGIFAELADHLLQVYETGNGLVEAKGFDFINSTVQEKFRESPVALRPGQNWVLKSWADSTIHGRPLLLAFYDSTKVAGEKLLLALVPISKRNFPRTGGFSYKEAWFFTFGKDYTSKGAIAAFPKKQLEEHLNEMKKFEEKSLNLVATNYGNDFYIVMLSGADSKALARDLFDLSTIFETPPE